MIITAKVVLKPNKQQESILRKFSGARRFVWNQCLGFWNDYYDTYQESPNLRTLLDYVKDLKYNYPEYEWLKTIPASISQQTCKDLCNAWERYFRGITRKPKFKSKGRSDQSFYQRNDGFHLTDDYFHIKLTGIKEPIKIGKNNSLALTLPHPKNPRVKFDGKYWYITVAYDVEESQSKTGGVNLGIDLGIKKLAYLSDGTFYDNINYTKTVKKLERRIKLLQRRLSRKYEANRQGNKYVKTNNIIKLENKIRLIHRRLKNIRHNYLHNVSKSIIKKAKCIALETLSIKGMMKNKHLSKVIQNQCLYTLKQFLLYKAVDYHVRVVEVSKTYPSSKRCSRCGGIKKNLTLSDRVYICDQCGLKIDRDYNAALNLKACI